MSKCENSAAKTAYRKEKTEAVADQHGEQNKEELLHENDGAQPDHLQK